MSEKIKISFVPPSHLKTKLGQETPETQEKTKELFAKLMKLISLLWTHFLTRELTENVDLLKIDGIFQDAEDFYGARITLILAPSEIYKSILVEAFWRLTLNQLEIGSKVAGGNETIKKDQIFSARTPEEATQAILAYLSPLYRREAISLDIFSGKFTP